jgi:hypothetical protein
MAIQAVERGVRGNQNWGLAAGWLVPEEGEGGLEGSTVAPSDPYGIAV